MQDVPMITLRHLVYNKETKMLFGEVSTLGWAGFPQKFTVMSPTTGAIVLFVKDMQAAIDNEFWDGELAEYVPAEAMDRVQRLVIVND